MTEDSLSPLEKHLALISIGPDVFRNTDPHRIPRYGGRGVFGGTFVAQSLKAAIMTVSDGFKPYSIHCNFIIGGDPYSSTDYKVIRTRDGKNYVTRQVKVFQKGKVIFICTISFQAKVLKGSSADLGPQLWHQPIMPLFVPPPEEMVDSRELLQLWLQSTGRNQVVRNMEENIDENDMDPCDWRLPRDYFHGEDSSQSERCLSFEKRDIKFWFRAKPEIQQESFHDVALAYCSDMYFLSSTYKLNFLNYGSLVFSVSLDHTIYFHNEIKADEWLLYVVKNPTSGHNRSLVTGQIFNREGVLVATVIQEGLAIVDKKKRVGVAIKESKL